jgi:hypothetical protein
MGVSGINIRPYGGSMSERAAFAPKERFSDPDSLGAVFVNDEGDLNVREAVASSDEFGPKGYVVTDDPNQIAALDRYEPLKRVSVSDADDAAKPKQRAIKKDES